MDDGMLHILVLGGLLIAFGGFSSYMAARQASCEEAKERQKPRRLRPSDMRRRQLRH